MSIADRPAPGTARSPGISYQELLDTDTHEVPETLRTEYWNSCLYRGRQLKDFEGHSEQIRCPFHGHRVIIETEANLVVSFDTARLAAKAAAALTKT